MPEDLLVKVINLIIQLLGRLIQSYLHVPDCKLWPTPQKSILEDLMKVCCSQ